MGVMKAPAAPLQVESPPKQRIENEKNKKVSFNDPEAKKSKSTNPRQIVPGVLVVSNEVMSTPPKSATKPSGRDSIEQSVEKSSPQSNSSHTNDSGIVESGVSHRDQLEYLAQVMGITVSYTDFPKGNHTEFLSIVSLSTDPPHMSHGSGSSRDESRDHAALKALTALTELGLDNVKPKVSSK